MEQREIRRILGGIYHGDDRAGDTGLEPLMDGTWVLFCAGAKTESQTAAVPAFTSRPTFSQPSQLFQTDLAVLQELPTSEVRWPRLESFLRQHLLHRARRRAVGYLLLL